jgi:hypothetical protein
MKPIKFLSLILPPVIFFFLFSHYVADLLPLKSISIEMFIIITGTVATPMATITSLAVSGFKKRLINFWNYLVILFFVLVIALGMGIMFEANVPTNWFGGIVMCAALYFCCIQIKKM